MALSLLFLIGILGILNLINKYLVYAPKPFNTDYLWYFCLLLVIYLVIQIVTGVTLAMHYNPSVLEAFNSVEHIMRDVSNGWLTCYLLLDTLSVLILLTYLHETTASHYNSDKPLKTSVLMLWTVIYVLVLAVMVYGLYQTLSMLFISYFIIRFAMVVAFSQSKLLAFLIISSIIRGIGQIVKPSIYFDLVNSNYDLFFYSVWCGAVVATTAYIVSKLYKSEKTTISLFFTFIFASIMAAFCSSILLFLLVNIACYFDTSILTHLLRLTGFDQYIKLHMFNPPNSQPPFRYDTTRGVPPSKYFPRPGKGLYYHIFSVVNQDGFNPSPRRSGRVILNWYDKNMYTAHTIRSILDRLPRELQHMVFTEIRNNSLEHEVYFRAIPHSTNDVNYIVTYRAPTDRYGHIRL